MAQSSPPTQLTASSVEPVSEAIIMQLVLSWLVSWLQLHEWAQARTASQIANLQEQLINDGCFKPLSLGMVVR